MIILMKIIVRFTVLILVFTTFISLFSCNGTEKQIKFDKNKWNEQSDPLFPSHYRAQMISDLTTNYKFEGIKYSELISLLGLPDGKDSNSLSYKIIVDYKRDIDPVYIKELEFYFSSDSIITSFKINEWKK